MSVVITEEHIAKMSDTDLRHMLALTDIIEKKNKPYHPHPKQLIVHRSLTQYTLAIAANRSGKSHCGAREFTWRLLGTHPYKTCNVPIKAWACAADFETGVQKILYPKIMSFLEPRHVYKQSKNSSGVISHIELTNGSTVDFKTYEQDTMQWESEDLDYGWLDEPPPREHFIAMTRGLVDRNGQCLITATPLREPWIHEELWQKGIEGDPNITCVNWSSYDNPHVNHDALHKFEARLSPEERKVRIYGEFKQLIGRVLKYFKEGPPIVIPSHPWPKDWPYFEGIDPHISKAHGFIRLGLRPDQNLVVFNAARPIGGMRELAKHILTTRPNSLPVDSVADTSLKIFEQSVGLTMQQQLEGYGVPTSLADKEHSINSGLSEMNEAFYRASVGEAKGLLVMDDSEEFINEAKRLRWDPKKKDVVIGDDDLIDPSRYLLVLDPWAMADNKRGEILKTGNRITYNSTIPTNKKDNRKYSKKAFDLDLDDEDDEEQQPRIVVRY